MQSALLERSQASALDTATIAFTDCRIPLDNILGSPEIDTQKSFRRGQW
ncbi:MAG: hypothetical protein R3B89_09580 [Polyangiaceae bacterium]